jgi:hypothetical protein
MVNTDPALINAICAVSKCCDATNLCEVEETARQLGYASVADLVAADLAEHHYGDDSRYFSILKQHLFGEQS